MPDERLREFYIHYVGAANARRFDIIAELVHDDVTINGEPHKRADVLASLKGIADAVPDFSWRIEDLLTEDDRIIARLHDTGTPTKAFLGLQPTGKAVAFTEFASYRVRDGRFAEMWFLMDVPTVFRQLAA